MPVWLLVFDQINYTLGVIMYSNESHFCCAVFIANLVFLYDGMPRTGTKLIHPVAIGRYSHPAGYCPIHVWYLQECHQSISSTVGTNRIDPLTITTTAAPFLMKPSPSSQHNQAPLQSSSLHTGLHSNNKSFLFVLDLKEPYLATTRQSIIQLD